MKTEKLTCVSAATSPFSFVLAQSGKGSSAGKLGLSKMICIVLLLSAATATAQFNYLASFNGTDGAGPEYMSMIQGTNGSFYGTAYWGGLDGLSGGTVFKWGTDGKLNWVYRFCSVMQGTTCLDGQAPYGGVIQAANGMLYGTTEYGGTANNGTVFEINPSSGKLTTIYNFCSFVVDFVCTDGLYPQGGLVLGADGNLYGTTLYGGIATQYCTGPLGCGTVFKINPEGPIPLTTSPTLYLFQGYPTDGQRPLGNLIQAANGDLFGTTVLGGESPAGDGTVFEITPEGQEINLYSFQGTNGQVPASGVIQATNGNFYGTTQSGGANGKGTVFEISAGTLTTLYSFCSQTNCTDGIGPSGALVQATDGNLYGTTEEGGVNLCRTLG